MNTDTQQGYEGWSVIELMGHRKLGAMVTYNPPELPGMLRCDVFADGDKPILTQYYAPQALYGLTPCTEETARGLGRKCQIQPVARYEMLPAPAKSPIPSLVRFEDNDTYDSEFNPEEDDSREMEL